MLNDTEINNDDLRRYWIIIGLEEVAPYKQASYADKKVTKETTGFAFYILQMRMEELRDVILDCMPKKIKQILLIVERYLKKLKAVGK